MANTWSNFIWIVLILTINCLNCSKAEIKSKGINFNSNDFEKLKLSIFTTQQRSEVRSDKKCLNDLKDIGSNLKEEWAMRILDAWGKLPSGIFEGNLQDFGSFSECFHIERDNKTYETKYCSVNVDPNLEWLEELKAKMFTFNFNNMFEPETMQADDEPTITPRRSLEMPKGLSIGICVPSSCSMDSLQRIVNKVIDNSPVNKKISITFDEKTCQLEEYRSQLETIDWVTIGLLGIILFFIVMNTVYDVLCTVYNRDKSQAMMIFSFYTNGMKLLSYKKSNSPDTMHCLNGIRVISTAWVVLGHTYATMMRLPFQNKIAFLPFLSSYHNMIIFSAHISVDTFFVMSGLLVSINMLKHLNKTKGRINVPLLYFHRFLRLTPLLAVTILFSVSLLRFLGNGPLWSISLNSIIDQCANNWWSTLLYIQNYVHPANKDMCFYVSWYLAVDTQLFLISPLVVYLIYRYKIKALFGMALLVCGCIGITLALHVIYDLHDSASSLRNELTYVPTHVRYGSWLIGIIAGYIFYNCRGKTIRIPKLLNLVAWTLSLATLLTIIFVNYPLQQPNNTNTPIEFGLYDALSRTTWAIALCYMIFACVHNSGGPVNWFLGHPLWQPIARVCYAIYIVHVLVVLTLMIPVKSTIYFTELSGFLYFIGNFVIAVFVAIILTLAFESPIIIIEKLIFGSNKKKESNVVRHKNDDQNNNTQTA